MRKLVLVLLLALTACASAPPPQPINKEFLNGSWEFLGMSKEVVPVEQIGKSDLLNGQMNFNADGTFTGDFLYPKTPERNTKANGTYTLENGMITINNQANNSSTKSDVKLEKDVLVVIPQDKNGFTMYFRRLR